MDASEGYSRLKLSLPNTKALQRLSSHSYCSGDKERRGGEKPSYKLFFPKSLAEQRCFHVRAGDMKISPRQYIKTFLSNKQNR